MRVNLRHVCQYGPAYEKNWNCRKHVLEISDHKSAGAAKQGDYHAEHKKKKPFTAHDELRARQASVYWYSS